MASKNLQGTIEYYIKGQYGLIKGEDGKEYCFGRKAVTARAKLFNGDVVRFTVDDMKSNVNKEKSNVKNDDCKIGGHVVPDDMAKNFGVPDDGTDIPVKKSLEEAASEADVKVDTEIIHVHRYFA